MNKILILFVLIFFFMQVGFVKSAEQRISNPSPDLDVIALSTGDTQEFSIDNNAEIIRWYLDGDLVKERSNVYSFYASESGIYTLRVDIIEGTSANSRVWNIIIEGESMIKNKGIEFGSLFFYVFITILLIVIFLVVRLLIIEKKNYEQYSYDE